MLAENGFLCSDIGKNAANDLKSCEEAKNIVKTNNPAVSTEIVEKSFKDQPKGCIMMENSIYYNSGSDDLPSQVARQVCKGIQVFCDIFGQSKITFLDLIRLI